MRYLLLVHHDEGAWAARDEAERQRALEESVALIHALRAEGRHVHAAPLHPTAAATSVRVRDGRRLVTDGPFAETREQLAGYFLVEAGSREEAVALAARIPAARWGTVEVRPVREVPGLP
ncbi:MAG TPA: YciI family protein [Candidatus Polarisedimenticolia bacterium]|nr:YciI family protein [Candidatus Polarisedimenticolia bacterium]